jgi:RNA-directed DNA polymerase
MSQDAPVNAGAADWPGLFSAERAVASMQAKLHLWAAQDPGRRFGDLFNLVYDPAFLRVAWERVATNKGASTPGIDRATAGQVEARAGIETFLGRSGAC